MRARILVGFVFVLLVSFAMPSIAAEPWAQPADKACMQVSQTPAPSIENGDALKAAIFTAGWTCSSHADCPCIPPGCYCTSAGRCICNMYICCPDGECP